MPQMPVRDGGRPVQIAALLTFVNAGKAPRHRP